MLLFFSTQGLGKVLQGCPIGKVGGSGQRGWGGGSWISISLVQAPVDRDGARPQREMVYLRSRGQWVARQDQDSVSGILVSSSPLHIPNPLVSCLSMTDEATAWVSLSVSLVITAGKEIETSLPGPSVAGPLGR